MTSSRDSIRIRGRSGQWEELGVDRWRGIVPEGITAGVDTFGPKTIGFTLKRDPRVPWGDLTQYGDLEYHRDGVLVWGGALQDAPLDASARTASVTAVGGRVFGEVAPLQKLYVHSRMTDWKDVRQCPTNVQTFTRPALAGVGFGGRGQVNVTDGMISIGWPGNSGTIPASDAVGVYLDLGDEMRAAGVYLAWESYNATALGAAPGIYLRGADAPPFLGPSYLPSDPISNLLLNGAGSNTGARYVFSRPVRYVVLLLFMNSAAAPTSALDVLLRVLDLRVFSSSSYVGTTGTFDLKADAVAKELVQVAGFQGVYSEDVTQIEPATFGIPHLTSDGSYMTAAAIMDKAYGFEDAFWGVDARRRVFTKNRPSAPRFRIVNDAAFKDSSGIAASDAYNGCIITGQDALGNPLSVRRHAAQGMTSFQWEVGPTQTNPSFDTALTGWVGLSGTFTRDTTVFDSSPASMKLVGPGTAYSDMVGLTPGRLYRCKARMRVNAAARAQSATFAVVGKGNLLFLEDGYSSSKMIPAANDVFEDVWLDFVAPVQGAALYFTVPAAGGTANAWIDSVVVWDAIAGDLDRAGYMRAALLESNAALTVAGANQLADLWLRLHTTTPFKGSVVVGFRDVLDYTSGRPVPLAELLLGVGEYAHFAGLRDPDSGLLGRDGLIVSASLNADADEVTLEVDNERSSFEKVLSRVGALQTFAAL